MTEEAEAYDYDLVVIGGGSGGLACAKEAAVLGAKVCCIDFVKPSPHGTVWGLGGTCVNVGCIPKKLFHTAALMRESAEESRSYGWSVPEKLDLDWSTLMIGITDHIGSLNWGYRTQLREKKVTYVNGWAEFVDEHTVEVTDRSKKSRNITGKKFVVAVGGRPYFPDVPLAEELCLTSDDIFYTPSPPGKTLVIGGSYVALECAGYLRGLGFDVTVLVRSILLRGFDQEMAEKIGEHMKSKGVKFIRPAIPTKFEKVDIEGKEQPGVKVEWEGKDVGKGTDNFETVLVAVGRKIQKCGLEKVGVALSERGKVVCNELQQSSVENIYAIGDCLEGVPELTPPAIQAGKKLARRLYSNSSELMDFANIPTTVFTPLEYGSCGVSEEQAIATYGSDDLEIYHLFVKPLEYFVPHKPENDCFIKLICVKSLKEKVVGFHTLGPHAGEVTQGFAVAMKVGATKHDFDETVGIHPTFAEDFTTMDITKRSGKDPRKTAC